MLHSLFYMQCALYPGTGVECVPGARTQMLLERMSEVITRFQFDLSSDFETTAWMVCNKFLAVANTLLQISHACLERYNINYRNIKQIHVRFLGFSSIMVLKLLFALLTHRLILYFGVLFAEFHD